MHNTISIRTYQPEEAAVFCKTTERFGGLSNMAGGFPLRVNGVDILTSEALYQACRFPHLPEIQRLIIDQRSPMTAKMKSKPHRDQSRADWDSVRFRIMRWCLRVKLAQNWNKFGDVLRSTEDMPIVEASRKDDVWGAKLQEEGTLVGMNVLGRLLMELREQLNRPDRDDLKQVEPIPIEDFLLFQSPIGVVHACRETSVELTDPDLTPPDGALWGLFEGPSMATDSSETIATDQQVAETARSGPIVAESGSESFSVAADTCYSRCFPLLLQYLRKEEPGERQLADFARRLDVLPKQLKLWLERGIEEGKVERARKKKSLVYVPSDARITLAPPKTNGTHRGIETSGNDVFLNIVAPVEELLFQETP